MTRDEVIQRLATAKNRAEVSRATGLHYVYLSKVAWGKIKNPGSAQVDRLRDYFAQQDQRTH